MQKRTSVRLALVITAVATATASVIPSSAQDAVTGTLAPQMQELLQLQPGGVQVSDNALV